MNESVEGIASSYRRFAEHEAQGRSKLYEKLACEIADDSTTLAFLAQSPRAKQQPNLLFAAMRYVCDTPADWREFQKSLSAHRDQIRQTMLQRRTQTNEPARCATLLPLLALLPQPLALLEIGASAGLCLIPDRYAYEYNDQLHIPPTLNPGVTPPTFRCEANAETPMPTRNLDVIWRAGMDLNPINVHDRDGVAWLEALVWPDEEDRIDLLRRSLNVAREAPPRVIPGDARSDLPALAARAPKGATLVIFHSAILAYISSPDERVRLANTIAGLNAVWISNEDPVATRYENKEAGHLCPPGKFLLSKNNQPTACTDPHGRSIRWFAI